LFFVVGGEEVPFYQMEKEGMVVPIFKKVKGFATNIKVAKIYTATQGFGIQKKTASFYIEFRKGAHASVIISTFNNDKNITPKFELRGKFSFLKKSTFLSLLKKESTAHYWAKRAPSYTKEMLEEIITIDYSEIRKGVRKIRLKRR